MKLYIYIFNKIYVTRELYLIYKKANLLLRYAFEINHSTLSTFKNAHIGKAIQIELEYLLFNICGKILFPILIKHCSWSSENEQFQFQNSKVTKHTNLTIFDIIIFTFKTGFLTNK